MNRPLKISVSPHIHSGRSTAGVMRDVLIALLPATVAGAVIFGLRSLLVVALCVACSVGFEALFNLICKKDQTVGDLSAAVTGLLLALNLPANIPLWQCVIGSLFAIVVVKCLFGGIGCNPVNPAITARVFMLVSFGTMAAPAFPKIVDTASAATPLAMMAEGQTTPIRDLLLGLHGGAIGETCSVALLIGFVYLLVRKVITWHTPVVFTAAVFVLYLIATGFDVNMALYQVLAGGLLIGAIFMATDYVTTPITTKGRVVFALGCAVITFIIRYFCAYPEGVSFSILIMNILTPYIEKWTAGEPLGGVK